MDRFLYFLRNICALCSEEKELRSSFFAQVRTFFSGTLGWKSLLFRLADTVKNITVNSLKRLDKKTKGRKIEYSILMVLIIFGVMYFSYGAFQCHSYGWGDMYVHHAWIYGLKEGNIFWKVFIRKLCIVLSMR